MTAVVETMSNKMAHEYGKEISHSASTNNEVVQNNGAESKLNSKEDVEMKEPTLESMGLQREAEDDIIVENFNASKVSSKRKSSEKGETKYCEKLLGEINEQQQEAINRISSPGGLLQMKKWLETARSEPKRLVMLLAQCWKAEINVDELSKTNIGKLVRELRKHQDSDVQTASNEVLKKWKQAVENDEMKKVNASRRVAATSSIPASAASKPVSVPKPSSSASALKPQSSAPVTSKVEKKNAVVSRPKTARTKNTAFRKTGFEEDEEESRAPAPKKPAPTIASQLSTPITKPTVAFPKKSPVVSNNFMNALSAGSSVNAMELQRKRKKPPPVIDLPLSSPLDPVVITPTTTTASVAGTVPPPDPLGPDPTRVPAPGARRRIHFADDKGEALVHTKFIENVLNNKAHRPNSDMKHADAEAERISLKQMKTDVDEEDEDEEMRMEIPEMGNTEVDSSWRLISYYKNAQNQVSQDLIDEEEARHGNVMRTFVAQPDAPLEHPSEPDDVENAITKFREPESIPIDFVMEETVEQEPMEVDAPASPDTSFANVSTVSPVPVPEFAPPPVSTSSIPVNNFQILNNIDVHGAGQALPPRPVPYPMNSMYSVPPPPVSRHEPQPVPPPSTEFIILEDEPSKLNASNLSNNSAIDANSFLQKLKGKGKSLDDILGKVKGSKIPVSSAPPSSSAASIPTNFSVPPPVLPGNMPSVLPVPPPSGEFQILSNIDIHASQAFTAHPRPSGPRMPNMPGGRQQARPPPGSSGKICPFYLKGTCTFGNNCFNEHRQPQQKPMGGGYRAAGPQYNQNRGGGSLRGRFNAPANKAPFNSSSQNPTTEGSQDQDNFYRSRKRSDDFRGSRRRDRSPSPRRGRRRSRSNSPERYHRRHRSRSPHSHSSSPDSKDGYRRRRRSPDSSRSPSRSPLPSRSPSKSPN